MAYTDLDRIAYRIGDVSYSDMPVKDQQRIDWTVSAVEQQLSLPPWGFRLGTAVFTEYLPSAGRFVDEVDLADYSIGSNGTVTPLDQPSGSSVLQLTHTPVALSGLVIYEDRSGYAEQGDTPYGAESLLTEGTDYYLDCDVAGVSTSGRVHRVNSSWSTDPRSIKATYYGGPAVAEANSLAGSFLEIYQEVVTACVLHNYSFWKQQQTSFASGNSGLIEQSESIGKYRKSLGSPRGTTAGGRSFTFGSAAELVPDALAAPLSSFVNLGALLCR